METSTRPATEESDAHAQAPGRGLAGEWGPMLRLAGPVVFAELGWMGMGVVDTLMVGRLGPEAIGAVGLGNSMHIAVVILGIGLMMGLDSLIAQAFGAGRIEECHRWLLHGLYLALAISPLLMGLVGALLPALGPWGVEPRIQALVGPYLWALNWSTTPLLVYSALRRHAQSMGRTLPIAATLVVGNLVNFVANALLIYGLFGFPRMGVAGSGWSTTLARTAMLVMLAGATLAHDRKRRTGLLRIGPRPEWARFRQVLALGLPASAQVGLEVGVFAMATALVGRLDAASLAAHEIVLNASSVAFMVPLGVASAGAVRVGHALGRGDPAAAARAGWSALALGAGFMTLTSVFFLLGPRAIVGLYTDVPSVTALVVPLLAVVAAFEVFDGLQVVATGLLRGVGDTRTPMICNLLAHWGVGLPIGYLLGFPGGGGVLGLWVGLAVGLVLAGGVLLAVWAAQARRLASGLGGTKRPSRPA